MTDKEKILVFLEGMSKGCCPNETKEIIINKIIPWINSLSEEPVISNVNVEPIGIPASVVELVNIPDRKEEPVSEELEEAAKEYSFNIQSLLFDTLGNAQQKLWKPEVENAFKAGAQWQKEQMTKDAVEAEIEITSKGILLPNLKIEDFDYADKARLIIIKEDEL